MLTVQQEVLMLMKDRKKDRKVEGIFHFLAIVRTGGSHIREREKR